MAFLDVEKAVWHEGLFVKLHEKNILLVDCCFLLKGKQSRVFSIKQGVRQGAILSPLGLNAALGRLCYDLADTPVKIVSDMLVPGVMKSILQNLNRQNPARLAVSPAPF